MKIETFFRVFAVIFGLIGLWCCFNTTPVLNYFIDQLVSIPELKVTLYWTTYCFCEGWLHAYYYAHEQNSTLKENFNEHPLFVFMRACVLLPLWNLTNWKTALCIAVMQPFFHNGSYYYNRNKIDGSYYYGWFDQSKTSTAWTTKFLIPQVRISLAIIGLIGLFYFYDSNH